MGPGLITSNVDNDAGGIATYSLVGAQTGTRLLWLLLPIIVALIIVQEMSTRMGIVAQKGLADLLRENFGLKITFYALLFLFFADLGNLTAEFAGIASAGEIFGISRYITVPCCAIFIWFLVLKGNYKIVERVFVAACMIYLSYVVSLFIIGPDWLHLANETFIPKMKEITSSDLPLIVGLIGTTIAPWMQFYIQAAVVEKGLKPEVLKLARWDVILGCSFMAIVVASIIICCSETLFKQRIVVSTAADAAVALAPLAGKYASILFAIGLFNASLFAAAILPLATSYYVCEGLGWEAGVDKNFREAPNFFTLFTTLIVFGSLTVLVPGINLFSILIWSQIINGLLIPFVLIFIIKLCNDPAIMGAHTNAPWYNWLCYGIVGLMILANFGMMYFTF
jgi:Mn2+/Fe2+ NRAMP family transporter